MLLCINIKILQMKAKDAFIFNLKHALYVHDYTYEDLGNKMGLSKQRVSALFNTPSGIRLNPVEKVAKALKIEETDLFDPNFQDKYKKKTK